MISLLRPFAKVSGLWAKIRNAPKLIGRVRNVKNQALGQLHDLRAGLEAMRADQGLLLHAALHLAEGQQQVEQGMALQHSQVLRQITILSQQMDALARKLEDHADQIRVLRPSRDVEAPGRELIFHRPHEAPPTRQEPETLRRTGPPPAAA
jgi:hypothetical protein